ncbi:LacI family DNA-binding transcriptional regulator [Streptomyces purpurogeneiscleroticus]|uniref:LacI family DNA-binding transcriptional regulator n=1 Tax=Streptomyces purpurogeneiscleroticus TaxID=68259 RepID=UPI001CBE3A51|nr:LacI family DNA-binding transcriptional regulator [Streptomyces purpurogeneiscleroticus]MBZ4020661.1 LacI family transcriptional regulator [Streptomyces purpurogeneiscleroticus]
MATMADVARRAGVSVSTVSHVINGTRFVKEETRDQVHAAMRESGYIPNTIARSLVTSSTKTLGLAVSAVTNFHFADMVSAIDATARAAGYTLLIADTHDDPAEELRVVQNLHQRRVDGLLLATAAGARGAALRYLTDTGLPTVLIDRCASPAFDQIGTANVESTARLVDHLADLGHTRIGMVAGRRGIRTSSERVRGWQRGMKRQGLDPAKELVVPGHSHAYMAQQVTERLLRGKDAPTALVVGNNHMTLGVLRALSRLGLKAPQDVALSVFDDFEWADLLQPQLTAIAQPVEEIGAKSVRMLIDRLADPDGAKRTVLLEPTLVHRTSCGCPAEPVH